MAAHARVAGPGGLQEKPNLPVVIEPKLVLSPAPYRVTVAKLPALGEAGYVHLEIKDTLADQQITLPQELQDWIAASAPVIQGLDEATGSGLAVSLSQGGGLSLTASAKTGLSSQVVLKSAKGALVLRIVKAP
jgi:hypothetical protein